MMQAHLLIDLETSKQIDELAPNEGVTITVTDSDSVIVVKTSNQLHAYRNRCPHRLKSLTDTPHIMLDDSHSLLECEHHGALFLLHNGLCVSGPCLNSHLEPVAIKQVGQNYTLTTC